MLKKNEMGFWSTRNYRIACRFRGMFQVEDDLMSVQLDGTSEVTCAKESAYIMHIETNLPIKSGYCEF